MGDLKDPQPRVLHLLSAWEWAGPAEGIVSLCRGLGRRGFVVDLACARAPADQPSSLEQEARERHVEPVPDFRFDKSANPLAKLADIRRLAEFLDKEEVQIVHVHTTHDHYIGSRAARRANIQPRVVRTNHHGAPLAPTWMHRWIIQGHTDAWVALTLSCREQDVRNFDLDPARAIAVEGTVDLERFDPVASRPDVRAALGLSPEHVIVGFVTRAGPDRGFDVFLQALARAMNAEPMLRALLLGRGMSAESPSHRAARELGIGDRVIFAGYRSEDYADHLAAMDFEVFLVPGRDGACPAAREAMAMGKPVIAGRRGLLPELVEDGKRGLVVEDSPESLAEAILRLAKDRPLREKLGRAAADKAREKFNIEREVEATGALYLRMTEGM